MLQPQKLMLCAYGPRLPVRFSFGGVYYGRHVIQSLISLDFGGQIRALKSQISVSCRPTRAGNRFNPARIFIRTLDWYGLPVETNEMRKMCGTKPPESLSCRRRCFAANFQSRDRRNL